MMVLHALAVQRRGRHAFKVGTDRRAEDDGVGCQEAVEGGISGRASGLGRRCGSDQETKPQSTA